MIQVDNNFFLVPGPIEQFESPLLVSFFPRANRIDVVQTREDIKRQLSKYVEVFMTGVCYIAYFIFITQNATVN